MTELFLKIINMSISASWLVLVVLALRFVFKKVPKWVNVLLWGIVAVRLICPFSIESGLSLIPSAETISPDIMIAANPTIQTGIPAVNSVVNPVISDAFAPEPVASANPLQIWIPVLAIIWAVGVAVFLVYTAVSYWSLRRKVSEAIILWDNIFLSENVGSPFVLGIIRPKIYLPFSMDEQDLKHVVAHEQAHICRKDHWWKPLGFLLLTIHWFNPLMWLAYALLCRDIELACDEKVIKELDKEQRADYTQALVACSVNRRMIAVCPLAFGEISVKERVKSVMNYKKPALWIVLLAIITCAAVAVCFLTDPAPNRDSLKWARALSVEDVESADLVVFPQTEDKQFESLSSEELADMVELINQSKGKYRARHEEMNGGSIFFYLMMKDGTSHRVGNMGNTYLIIDGDYYEADYNWLVTWDDAYNGSSDELIHLMMPGDSSLICNAESEGCNAEIAPDFYPNGFDWNYEQLANGEMLSSGKLIFTANWETEELIVSEDYYEETNSDSTVIHKENYTLVRNAEGKFELDAVYRNPGKEEMAVYFIQGETGTYVMKIFFGKSEHTSSAGAAETAQNETY